MSSVCARWVLRLLTSEHLEEYKLSSTEKAKVPKSLVQNMFIHLIDRKGVILTHAVPNVKEVKFSNYCSFLFE